MNSLQESGVGSRKSSVPRQLAKASNFDYSAPFLIENTQRERLEGFIRPTGGVENDGPYEFVIPPSDTYLQLSTIHLYIKCKIVRENGNDLHATDIVAPINMLASTLWEHTEISLNDYNISGASASNTHYKALLETLLSFSNVSLESVLRSQLFALDTPNYYDDFDHTGVGQNKGFKARREVSRDSNVFDMDTSITADFLRCMNHLAPGNKLGIKLYKARDSFVLNTSAARRFRVKLLDLRLYYNRIRLSENSIPPQIERYPIDRTELKRYPVPQGLHTYNVIIHQGGPIPKQIIVAQVSTTSAEGDYGENPFNFQHFSVNKIHINANGKQFPPDSLETNFDSTPRLVSRAYNHLMMNTGMWRQEKGNLISFAGYQAGQTLFGFDMSPDLCNGFHIHPSPEGHVTLEISWRNALPHPITLLVHSSFESVIVREKGHLDFLMETI